MQPISSVPVMAVPQGNPFMQSRICANGGGAPWASLPVRVAASSPLRATAAMARGGGFAVPCTSAATFHSGVLAPLQAQPAMPRQTLSQPVKTVNGHLLSAPALTLSQSMRSPAAAPAWSPLAATDAVPAGGVVGCAAASVPPSSAAEAVLGGPGPSSDGEETSPSEIVRNIKEVLADQEQVRRKAHESFTRFDSDSDGSLSIAELGRCIAQLDRELGVKVPCSGEEVARQLRRFDRDSNGSLDYWEYESLYRNLLLTSLHRYEPTPFCREMFIGRRHGRPEDHYDIMETLGQGAFGIVSRVVCKESGSVRCMKSVEKRHAEASGMPMALVVEEIDKLKTLDHPAILRLFEYFVDPQSIHLVTDVLMGGHLLQVLEQKILAGQPPTEKWVCDVFVQVCRGIAYAHGKGVMHKDLKLDNMMLDSQEPPRAVVIDVGFAEIFPPSQAGAYRSTTKAGTLSTMAPEVIMQSFTCKCDVWSLGCCLYGVLCKKPTAFRKPNGSLEVHPYPFIPPEENTPAAMQAFMEKQRRGPDWEKFTGGVHARDLLTRMLAFDERARLTMKQVLSHAWFSTPEGKQQVLSQEQLQCLLGFHRHNALEHAVLVDVASQVPIDQLHGIARTFEAMDVDCSGQLDAQEFAAALQNAGLEPQLAAQAAQSISLDCGGCVEFSTFVAALVQSQRSLFRRHLRNAFNRLDTDGSGFITQDELRHLLEDSHLQQVEAQQASQSIFDVFGDCRLISFDQLLEYFSSNGRAEGP